MKARTLLLTAILSVVASKGFPGEPPPIKMDGDRDGICNDCEERIFSTAPNNKDTDKDGIPDGLEDHDGNGLTNLEEQGKIVAFMNAVESGDIDSVKKLMGYGRYMAIVGRDGMTALMVGAERGYEEIVRGLLNAGVHVNEPGVRRSGSCCQSWSGSNALGYASRYAHTRTVRILLQSGADVNSRNDYGVTALMMAAGSSDAPVRAWLDPDSGAPFETAKLLLEAGSNANAKDNYRRTALMTAARSGNAEIVKLLLEAGADVKAKDEGGRNALQIAIDESRDEIIQMLTKAGDE